MATYSCDPISNPCRVKLVSPNPFSCGQTDDNTVDVTSIVDIPSRLTLTIPEEYTQNGVIWLYFYMQTISPPDKFFSYTIFSSSPSPEEISAGTSIFAWIVRNSESEMVEKSWDLSTVSLKANITGTFQAPSFFWLSPPLRPNNDAWCSTVKVTLSGYDSGSSGGGGGGGGGGGTLPVSDIYLIDKNSDIFYYDKTTKKTTFATRAYGATAYQPTGLAVANDNNSLYFYVARNLTGTKANLSIYDDTGQRLKTFDFDVGSNVLSGLSLWPNNSRILVAHSTSSLFVIDLESSAAEVTEIQTQYSFVGGLAAIETLDATGFYASFHIAVGDDFPRRIRILRLNRNNKTFDLRVASVPPLSVKYIPRGMKVLANNGASTVYSFHQSEEGTVSVKMYEGSTMTDEATLSMALRAGNSVTNAIVNYDEETDVTVVTREYDPSTGEFIGDASNLNLGEVKPGGSGETKAIDMTVNGVSAIRNVTLGVLNVQPDSLYVQTLLNVDVYPVLPYTATPSGSFYGLSSGTFDDTNNYKVGAKEDNENESNYVLFMMNVPNDYTGEIAAQLKWFFDFE